MIICFVRIMLSWFPGAQYSPVGRFLSSLCDPYLNRNDFLTSPLLVPCQQLWQRFGNGSPQKLAALAAQLKEYFAK